MTANELKTSEHLQRHIETIASAPRNIANFAALNASAAYIESTLDAFGYAVGRQEFSVDGRKVRNIDVTLEPTQKSTEPVQTIVVGAHYDSYRNAPGANDNGSGVAATLELARLLKSYPPAKFRIRLVFFVNEEPPYFRSPNMGSLRYAQAMIQNGERIRGMISLDAMGSFASQRGTQRFPWPYNYLFGDRANFIAFLGLPGGRTFMHDVVRAFRSQTQFPSIAAMGIDGKIAGAWSDHWSFDKYGIPAMVISDTGPFRYRHLHRPSDTPDKIDFRKLARVTLGLVRAIALIS
ncbi:MAG: M28 family peptidase [Hyphomicrobiaceae bacterium]